MTPRSFKVCVVTILVLCSWRVGLGQAVPADETRCVCGADAARYGGGLVNTPGSRLNFREPEGCLEEGRALLRAVYDQAPKVPPGFQGHELTDFQQTVSVQWIRRPSTPRIEGSYRVDHTLAHAATLAEARHEVEEFVERGRAIDLFIPHLVAPVRFRERERPLFFEFLAPSDISGKAVTFRVWKTGFLVPAANSLLADADRTGSLTVGTVPKTIDVADVSLFLEGLWWENYANVHGAKVLRLPEIRDARHELRITMPVTFLSGGDWGLDDQVARHLWKIRVNRETGELIRVIEPDILCIGKHIPDPIVE